MARINEAVNAGLATSPRIFFRPYDFLKTTGRDTGGKGYKELKAAMHRLRATGVAYESLALKGKHRKQGAFNLLSAFEFEETPDGKAKGAWIELPLWLYQAVTKDRDVLAISPQYFGLTSGLDRFLYRLARRHVGQQAGWAFTFKDLHGRSGSAQKYGDFARDLRKAITRNALPEYSLAEVEGANGPTLSLHPITPSPTFGRYSRCAGPMPYHRPSRRHYHPKRPLWHRSIPEASGLGAETAILARIAHHED